MSFTHVRNGGCRKGNLNPRALFLTEGEKQSVFSLVLVKNNQKRL